MALELATDSKQHPQTATSQQAHGIGRLGTGLHDLNQQCLRILRCTAAALAHSPGGLRFKAGTRPWLEGLPNGRAALANPH